MNANWKDIFLPHILSRGKNYFKEGHVRQIRHSGNTYIANVTGAEEYVVEIDINNSEIGYMECSCPYAAHSENRCKHMAAVLFALNDGASVEEIPPRRQPVIVEHVPINLPWLDAIDHLPDSVVRKKLMQLADRNDALKERLTFLYLGGLPDGQLQNWKADLQQSAFVAANRYGVIEWEDADIFFMDLENFMSSKLSMLLEAKAYMDAAKMIWIVLETAMEQAYDAPDSGLLSLKEECKNNWKTVFKAATDPVRQEMLNWFGSVCKTVDWTYDDADGLYMKNV